MLDQDAQDVEEHGVNDVAIIVVKLASLAVAIDAVALIPAVHEGVDGEAQTLIVAFAGGLPEECLHFAGEAEPVALVGRDSARELEAFEPLGADTFGELAPKLRGGTQECLSEEGVFHERLRLPLGDGILRLGLNRRGECAMRESQHLRSADALGGIVGRKFEPRGNAVEGSRQRLKGKRIGASLVPVRDGLGKAVVSDALEHGRGDALDGVEPDFAVGLRLRSPRQCHDSARERQCPKGSLHL